MFEHLTKEVATVGAVITDLLYTAISLVLVGIVGRALSRNSHAFLPQRFGHDGMAEAVSRVLVVAYYLLAAGFIALTMPTWSHVSSPGQAMELLSVQVGILLLVLGALHLAGTAVLARLRRGPAGTGPASPARPVAAGPLATGPPASSAGGSGTGGSGTGGVGDDGDNPPGTDPPADPGGRLGSPRFWRPEPRDVVH
jgi:hypothetical protein